MISMRKDSLYDMCSNAINDSWIYSAHWGKAWKNEALADAKKYCVNCRPEDIR